MNPAIWDVERAKRDEQIRRADHMRLVASSRPTGTSRSAPLLVLRRTDGAALVNAGYALAGQSARDLRQARDVGAEMRPLSR